MVKYCQNCGSQLVADDSFFCSRCGANVCIFNSPQEKSVENNQQLTLDEATDLFYRIFLASFDDVDKLDEITTIKYIIKLSENDLKQTEGFSRGFRTNRISIIQGTLSELGFDIDDNTVEYLYDSIISDMDLHKIPSHSILHHECEVIVHKDDFGVVFYEYMCPACDENIRFELTEQDLKANHQRKLICSNCSYKGGISQSSMITK